MRRFFLAVIPESKKPMPIKDQHKNLDTCRDFIKWQQDSRRRPFGNDSGDGDWGEFPRVFFDDSDVEDEKSF